MLEELTLLGVVEEVRIHEKSNGLACHIEVRDHFALV